MNRRTALTSTLLITTYNWPEALELVIQSVLKQSVSPTEILIADDGSGPETQELIRRLKAQTNIPIRHLWHEDQGFTKTIILNKALKSIRTDYTIQIDGDVVLHQHFVRDHLNNARAGLYLFGSRVSINKSQTKIVLNEKITRINWFSTGLKRRRRALYRPFKTKFTKPYLKTSNKLRGCNMSYWTQDALNINGYNEDLIGWGYEDYNFAERLLNNGILPKRLKHCAIQFHLYHPEAPKGDTSIGDAIMEATRTQGITKCKNGIEKL